MWTKIYFISTAFLLLIAAEGSHALAWDHTTNDPCDVPVEITPEANEQQEHFSTTIDLNVPLASEIKTDAYNADLSRSDIDVGTAMVTDQGTYLNVMGNEVSTAAPEEAKKPGCR